MVIKKKVSKSIVYEQTDIEDMIGKVVERGGKTAADIISDQVQEKQEEEEVRFTLRIPLKLIKKIDDSRKSRVGNVSRNQWIIEAVNRSCEK